MPRKTLEYEPMDELGNIRSFDQVEKLLYLSDGRWRAHRKIQRNTELSRVSNGIALAFHNTHVITWNDSDLATLETNQYYTTTTRKRISEWLPGPLEIYEQSGYWWVRLQREDRPFHDGMVIDLDTMTEFGPAYDIASAIVHNREWEEKISTWMKRYKDGSLIRADGSLSMSASVENGLAILQPQPMALRSIYNNKSSEDFIRSFLRHHLLMGAYTGRKVTPGWNYDLPSQKA